MLSKLFKYEMKSTARIFLPFWGAILLLAVINRITLSVFSNIPYFQVPQALLMTLYVVLLIATFVMSLIVMIQRFYKNLLGQEGYLMFTLPVKAGANILSKGIAAFIWMLGTLLVAFSSILITIPDSSWIGQIPRIWNEANQALSALGGNLTVILWLFVGICIFGLIAFTMQAYLSMALGQLSNNHKLLCSFGSFLGIYFALQTVLMVSVSVMGFSMVNSVMISNEFPGTFVYTIFGVEILLQIGETIGFYFLTRYLLNRKLNLE